jgi:hypothetical protein
VIEVGTEPVHDALTTRARSGFRRLPLLVTIAAGVALVVGTIGPPMFRRGVFLATEALTGAYPWRAVSDPTAENFGHHGPVGDTVEGIHPFRSTFADTLRDGDFLAWKPLHRRWHDAGVRRIGGDPEPLRAAVRGVP